MSGLGLPGRVVVVTGAGSGIGRALAVELCREGSFLVLADRDPTGLASTAVSIEAERVLTRTLDVSVPDQLDDLAAAAVERFGRVDVLVNNAAVAHADSPFWELPATDFQRVLDDNLAGVVHGCRSFLPLLVARPAAALLNVSSLFGLLGTAGQTAYCTSKFAVRGFTEALRMELRQHAPHVRAISVHPGGVRTAIARNSLRSGRSDEAHRASAEAFEDAVRTTPQQAARTIVRGIRRGRERILIGADAHVLDLLARALPRRYTDVLLRATP